jgi:putative peptidoglycan lipid II flippase
VGAQATGEGRKIALVGGLLFAATLATKAAGYVGKVLIARRFGTGGDYDAYVLAFTIPDILLFLVIGGAVSSAFVPVTTERLAKDLPDEAVRVVNGVMTAAFLILGGAVLVLEILAPVIVGALAHNLPPDGQALAINITRILLIQALFLGLGGFATGVMIAYRRFVPYALAPFFYDLAIIFAALFLTQLPAGGGRLGVTGLAIGVALGGVLHLGVQVPSLWRIGWRPVVPRALKDPAVWRVARLTVPISIGLIAIQANVAIDRYLASSLPAGRVSALDFANEIAQIPNLTFTTALVVVMFPYFARDAALGRLDSLRRRAALAVRLNLFVLIPAAVGLVVLGPQLVALLLQRGAFDANSTSLVAASLALFAVGIAGQASIFLVVRVYYSLQQVVTPMLIALASVVVNVVCTLVFLGPLGAAGLALATSIASTFNFVLLVWLVRRRIGGFEGGQMAVMLAKVSVGCVALAVVAYGTWVVIAGDGPVRLDVRHYLALGLAILLASAAYLGVQFALRSSEAGVAIGVFLRRRSAVEPVESAA